MTVAGSDVDTHPGLVPHPPPPRAGLDRALHRTIAILVVAQAAVVGLQVVGRHILKQPIPWTEEIARLLLVWLMCVGGVSALAHGQHPRVTALIRLLPEERRHAVDRGLRLVLLALFISLIVPAWNLTVTSAAERLPASGLSGAAISAIFPLSLAVMCGVLIQQLRNDRLRTQPRRFSSDLANARPREHASPRGPDPAVPQSPEPTTPRPPDPATPRPPEPATPRPPEHATPRTRERANRGWSFGAAALVIASVLIPLLADAPPLVVLVTGFLATAALGMPLAFTLALTALTYLLGIGGVGLIILPIKILGGVDSFVLLSIPLFIVAGALMETGGISERIVDLAMAIVGSVRGGLAMVAVVAEILFSGISGSTAADVSAISSLLVPSMRRAGYSGPEAVSVVAAASAMGILVPPCLTMVVLGSLVNLSIVTLFLAGFVPAFILAAALLVLIGIRARRQNWPVTARASRSHLGRTARRAMVPLGLPVLLFGGIFTGATTVTEAALLAVVYALVAGLMMGGIRRNEITAQLAQSGIVTATTLWVLAAASAFAWILVREWVPQSLGDWMAGVEAGRWGFLALTIVLFVVIGALLEGLPALLIFGPILFPISRALGIDPVHYGIVIIAAMGIAFFLPPIGVGLSIAAGIARVDIDEASRSYVPYLVALLVGLALIAAFPVLTLVLPRALLGYRH